MNTPLLKTERLILRRFGQNDVEDLYRILSDEEVNRFLPWFALENIEEAREFFDKRYAAKYALPRGYAYAICLKEDDRPIGYVNIDADEPYDLGYGLCKEFWGRGIHRSGQGGHSAGKNRRHTLHYGDSRHKQSAQRRSYAQRRDEVHVLL